MAQYIFIITLDVVWKLQPSATGGDVASPIKLIIANVNSEFEGLLIFIVVTPFLIKKV